MSEQVKEKSDDKPGSPKGSVTLPQSIVVSSLIFSGVAVFTVIAVADVDWFYPVLAYMLAVYFAWQHFMLKGDDNHDGGEPLKGESKPPNGPSGKGEEEVVDEEKIKDAIAKLDEIENLVGKEAYKKAIERKEDCRHGLRRAIPRPKRLFFSPQGRGRN